METQKIQRLAELFEAGPAVFLTGAGISTDSGIPDYRGAGTPPRKPMNIDEFLYDNKFRKRYWAGASVNAQNMQKVQPNEGHKILARLEKQGLINGVITQNVDDLHNKAGSKKLVELHGNGNRVICTQCGHIDSRKNVIKNFNQLNPGYTKTQKTADINPDQDANVTEYENLKTPVCTKCGGLIRPDIVYFGETVPQTVFEKASKLIESSKTLIVAGSSLAVNTGIRIITRAERKNMPITVINIGPTAIDHKIDLKIENGTTQTLTALEKELTAL